MLGIGNHGGGSGGTQRLKQDCSTEDDDSSEHFTDNKNNFFELHFIVFYFTVARFNKWVECFHMQLICMCNAFRNKILCHEGQVYI